MSILEMPGRSMSLEYGKRLVEIGRKNSSIFALEADLKESTQSVQFQRAYPDRYIEVGIAEQNMIGIAAGLALEGKIPVVHSFAAFLSMRACEFIRTSIAYPKLNVKFLASHGGISSGTAGTTHHAIEDIAIMRSIPNMVVLVPGDIKEMRQAVAQALRYRGPVYIRLSAGEVSDIYCLGTNFTIGKATELRRGNDAAIISTGIMSKACVVAADLLLRNFKIRARVLQMASVKPIDYRAVVKAAKETPFIITVEEHNVLGGLGGVVAEIAAESGGCKVRRLGINDHFCGVGSAAFLMEKEGLSAENIVKTVLDLAKKGKRNENNKN
jgi:transketolase